VGDVHFDGLTAFHQFEQVVLQRGLPPGEGVQLVFQVGQLPGADVAVLEQLAVAVLAGADGLDVGLLPGRVPVQVAERRFHGHQLVLLLPMGLLPLGDLRQLGQRPPPVVDPGQLRVDVGEVEQQTLHGGVSSHAGVLRCR
jgi:hypothetical protein